MHRFDSVNPDRTGPSPARVSYDPDLNERRLIARLLSIMREFGYAPAPMPTIVSTMDPPPLFLAYPELDPLLRKSDYESGNSPDDGFNVPGLDREGIKAEFDIELLLGTYHTNHQIVLYERGFLYMQHRGYSIPVLRAVVLTHELGHWISHCLPKPGVLEWQDNLYDETETEVHEGFAQLLTWMVAQEVEGRFKSTFEELNRDQSPPYHVYERFFSTVGPCAKRALSALQWLRRLDRPATLQDWLTLTSH